MSASATASGSDNLTAAEILYPCPEGYFLTYVKTQESYNASLDEVLAIGADFQNATVSGSAARCRTCMLI